MNPKIKDKNLAINGGPRVRTRPWIDNFTTGEEEKRAVLQVMDEGYLSKFEGSFTPDPPFSFYGGPRVQELEKRWCAYYGMKHGISMNSATSGLYAALGALGIGYGDEVIVPPSPMSACAPGPLLYGAIPIFADVEMHTGCLDPTSIEKLITKRTKVVVIVHQFGFPADMDRILTVTQKHGVKVIEDCAQAHGAKYKGRYVGTMGDIGVFSLNVNKTIQCGEGAVCVTNDADLAYRLALIRNHGEAVVGPAEYKNILNILGFNLRLTEVQAAIAIEQLKKLDALNEMRLDLVFYLQSKLREIPFIKVLEGHANCVSTYYQFPLLYKEEVTQVPYADFRKAVHEEGAYFFGVAQPFYMQPLYQEKKLFKYGYPFAAPPNAEIKTNYYAGACPTAELLWKSGFLISEHIRPPHTRADMDDIVSIFEKMKRILM